MRGWLTFPLGFRIRLGISPSRSWLSFPIFGGIRGGVSVPVRRRKKHTAKEIGRPAPDAPPRGKMPGEFADD
jgi:hypothetical protein